MAPNPPHPVQGDVTAAMLNSLVGRYDVDTSEVDVVSTATETTIFSATIGAGHPSTDRKLRLTIEGDMLQNAEQAADPTIRLKLGATTIATFAPTMPNSATRKGVVIEATISNLGAADSQWGRLIVSAANAASFASAGMPIVGTAAEDTALELVLAVTVQWSASSATRSFRKKYAELELVG